MLGCELSHKPTQILCPGAALGLLLLDSHCECPSPQRMSQGHPTPSYL